MILGSGYLLTVPTIFFFFTWDTGKLPQYLESFYGYLKLHLVFKSSKHTNSRYSLYQPPPGNRTFPSLQRRINHESVPLGSPTVRKKGSADVVKRITGKTVLFFF